MKMYNVIVPAAAAVILGIVAIGDVRADTTTSSVSGVSSTAGASNAGNSQSVQQPITVCVNPGSCPDSPPAPDTRALPAPSETTATVRSVPTAIAPALTTTLTETCMGSSSVGASGVGFGVSFGTTWRDVACVRRLDSREVGKYSQQVAFEMMCDSEAVRKAAERAAAKYGADKVPVCAEQK